MKDLLEFITETNILILIVVAVFIYKLFGALLNFITNLCGKSKPKSKKESNKIKIS